MSQLEDRLREAYREERFTMTVSEIEARAGRGRRRRVVALAVAGGLVVVTTIVYLVVPRGVIEPPVTGPTSSATASPPARPVSRENECREQLAKDGRANLPGGPPVELLDVDRQAYLFSDGNASYSCLFSGAGNSTSSIEPHLATPLSRTAPAFTIGGEGDRGMIVGALPYGMRRVDFFAGAGTARLDSNGTIFYGFVWFNLDFHGIKATAESDFTRDVFTATATAKVDEPAATRAAQESACREAQLRMPVPHVLLSMLGSRDVDSQTSVLLLAGPDNVLAVCRVFNGTGETRVKLTVANQPIYDGLLEQKDTTVHKAVMLVRRFSEDAGKGRVVLTNGQRVPLVFADGYATAWFDRPEGVQADHVEVDLSSGGHTDFPLPLR